MGVQERAMGLAAQQLNLLSAGQCSLAGISKKVIRGRLEQGTWRQVHRGIYVLGPGQPSLEQRELGALLVLGPRAALSHLSAAHRHGLVERPPALIHVTVPATAHPRPLAGVKVWRARSFPLEDIARRGHWRFTKLGRTLFDLAMILPTQELLLRFHAALRASESNLWWIRRVLEREPRNHRGAGMLRRLVREYLDEPEIPDSELESFAMELGMATGRKPVLHQKIHDSVRGRFIAEVDLAWPEAKLCVEMDGWKTHGSKSAFKKDRRRDRELAVEGQQVLRYVWDDVKLAPRTFVDEITKVYDRRTQKALRDRDAGVARAQAPPPRGA